MATKRGNSRLKLKPAVRAFAMVLAAGWMTAATAEDVDGTPPGMVAFFNTPACPTGWSAAGAVQGRAVIAVQLGSEVGKTVGTPLADKTPPTHGHAYQINLDLPDKTVSLASCSSGGTCDKSGGKKGTYTVRGNTDTATSGLPFIQLTVCQKQ